MNAREHEAQRARVAGSLQADEQRDHRHDCYVRHPLSRVVEQGEPSIGSLAQSIRELGEMLVDAEQHPDFRTRLAEVERLNDRVADHVAAVRALVTREYEGMAL